MIEYCNDNRFKQKLEVNSYRYRSQKNNLNMNTKKKIKVSSHDIE